MMSLIRRNNTSKNLALAKLLIHFILDTQTHTVDIHTATQASENAQNWLVVGGIGIGLIGLMAMWGWGYQARVRARCRRVIERL